ncbi:MAG: cation transporter [Hyphomonas sp.]|uniref:cation diffusion facilitator family transporter n=1 Tax=Hyphomonas sp. TaxID=87 RepID=UPI0017C16F72|nr:cation diffusion facilitator family transporter [Hyphomonas sp.]MBU3922584.1 cation diffusion facilitator family transporter [Alphaproteobacteria bacterium]MBA3068270.1 cation transporter [Hyphomonas sp.]MBU4060864.1 cation diffusion facilitator family transporter [Alphaproteobacteria bacterium]MBU4164848.1 cation diffusion facilitator family transporter [Alphaproteobacteria bacterium]MBU4568428.1 cation diffusion facilitator family transporter [Alphaproteobacteria bacterium]
MHDHTEPTCPEESAHAHAHAHGLAHTHDHEGHAHHQHHADMMSADARRRVVLAALLTGGFMLAEVIGGLVSGSLALLADAAHMLTDTGSLLLAWLGYKLAARPADPERSFGFGRMKVLAAFTNGVLLILLALWIVWEAVNRLLLPSPVLGELMLGVAVLGLVVNVIAFAILHGGSREDLNLRGALWHVAGDLLGSVAAILAAVLILWQGWYIADPLLSILVAGLALFGGLRITREAGHILIEGTPHGLEAGRIIEDLKTHVPGVANVAHVHAWALTESRPLVTLEVTLGPGASAETVRRAVKERLAHAFAASHATVEVIGDVSPPAA